MIDPRHISWPMWSASVIQDYSGKFNLPICPEHDWRRFGVLLVARIADGPQPSMPLPHTYQNWREWAAQVYGAKGLAPG